MSSTEKIILGSTAVVAVSAITLLMISKRYETAVKEVNENLKDVKYTLSKSREDIIIGNKEITEGNNLLRTLVKQSVQEATKNDK